MISMGEGGGSNMDHILIYFLLLHFPVEGLLGGGRMVEGLRPKASPSPHHWSWPNYPACHSMLSPFPILPPPILCIQIYVAFVIM